MLFVWILDKGSFWGCTSLLHVIYVTHNPQLFKLHKNAKKSLCYRNVQVAIIFIFLIRAALPKHLKWRLPKATVLVSPHITCTLHSMHADPHWPILLAQGQSNCSVSECVSVFCCTDDGGHENDNDDFFVCVLLGLCDFDVIRLFLFSHRFHLFDTKLIK